MTNKNNSLLLGWQKERERLKEELCLKRQATPLPPQGKYWDVVLWKDVLEALQSPSEPDPEKEAIQLMVEALEQYAKTENWQPWPFAKGYTQCCLDWKLADQTLQKIKELIGGE